MKRVQRKKKNKGFTLGEMVTTTAIVGILTAVAVPNYMRIKMQVNMEMVKQHLKTIGTHMSDLYNRDRMFPENILDLGNSDEEVAITANLSAIDNKGYTIRDGYMTYQNRSNYTFRTCPQEGRWGISGDRCFLLDPMGVREMEPWDGSGMAMIAQWQIQTSWFFGRLFTDPNLTERQKLNIIEGWFEKYAYWVSYERLTNPWNEGKTGIGSVNYSIYQTDLPKLNANFPEIFNYLGAKGIHIFQAQRSAFDTDQRVTDRGGGSTLPKTSTVLAIGFELDKPITTRTELTRLTMSSDRSDNIKAYDAYAQATYGKYVW